MLAKQAREGAHPVWLLAVLLLAMFNQLWGLGRDLPHIAEIDESTFVGIAVEIAATGDLTAANMGHPGTTLSYPLAALYWLGVLTTGDEVLFQRAAVVQERLHAQDAWLYHWGRRLTGIYAVGAAVLLYGLGQRLLDERVGLVAALLFMSYPGVLQQTKLVRTDSPSLFFTLLAIWLILSWWATPNRRRLLVVGLAIGVAIATKYYLLTLMALPAGLILWRAWSGRTAGVAYRRLVGELGLLLGAVTLGLGLAHPFFFLDWRATLQMLLFEARTVHPGADGLSPAGNFLWYLRVALPANISVWQLPACLFGLCWVVVRRRPEPLLLLGFGLLFILSISQLALHQARWLLPVLPLLALFSALGLVDLGDILMRQWGATGWWRRWGVWAPAALTLLPALMVAAQTNQRLAASSTRVIARDWVVSHLPRRANIAYEEYSIDDMTGYSFMRAFALGEVGEDLAGLQARGYEYVVVSSEMYNRYLEEPERFSVEATFYQELFREGELLQEITPSQLHAGPTIRVYRIG